MNQVGIKVTPLEESDPRQSLHEMQAEKNVSRPINDNTQQTSSP